MIGIYNKRRCAFLMFTAILGIAFICLVHKTKWINTAEVSQIQILISDDQLEIANLDGNKISEEVGDSQYTTMLSQFPILIPEDEIIYEDKHSELDIETQIDSIDGWKIIYNEMKLRAEVKSIHESNYKVKDGDTCVKSVPDCMIVGVAKCGTRELIDFMSIHPNIIAKTYPYMINPSFFRGSSAASKIKRVMPCKYHDQISVVKADDFLTATPMPREIFRLNPNMKIIAIVREPVSRLISHLSFAQKNTNKEILDESSTINRWLTETINNLTFRQPYHVMLSTYDKGLERYMQTFKRDNVLVIESNEFKTDPTSVIGKVEQFLGIKRFVSNDFFAFNPQKKFFCIRKTKSVSKIMACYESNRGRKTSIEIDDEHMEALRNYFRPHNENLYRLIGKRYDW